jgi:cell division protein ZapE
MKSPLEIYQQAIQSGRWRPDPAQAAVMEHLQRIYTEIFQSNHSPSWMPAWIQKIFKISPSSSSIQGLYLWGGVGVGKTGLMDMFFQSLPTQKKLRLHFHRFMRQVHQELTILQGQPNPLKIVAAHFAQQARVLCFDEFIVNDITDAMLLGQLLEALFEQGVILIATSNTPPDELYRNGLQRQRFLPAIDLIKQYTHVFNLHSTTDYRLRTLESAGVYFCPLDSHAEQAMKAQFELLAPREFWSTEGEIDEKSVLIIEGRPILTVCYTEDIAWFKFEQLCQVPRSQLDYLEIASSFSTVFLSHIPQIPPDADHLISYLINLVDIFYDARVKLIISAAVPVQDIYTEGHFEFEFQRTCSRLLEMQSRHYLGLEHLA